MKLVFAGTPDFARVALDALHQAGHEIVGVWTQPDRPAGRGQQIQASPVKQLALAHGWPVWQPRSLRLDGAYAEDAAASQAALRALQPDVMVVAAYGLILPTWTLQAPRWGCVNIHASCLPRWRGAAPIHRALEAGDAETGVTLMQMDEGLDTGDLLRRDPCPIEPDDTTARLHDRLAHLGGQAITALLQHDGPWPRQAQPDVGVTYAHKIQKAEGLLDWSAPADVLARRVRAWDPFPGAQMDWGEARIKVWSAKALGPDPRTKGLPPGAVLGAGPDGVAVVCGEGTVLVLQTVQRPGGRRQPVAGLWQGHPLPIAPPAPG